MICSQCSRLLSEGAAQCACGASVHAEEKPDPLIGQYLLNQFLIKKKLGEGGFGAVYLAEQPALGRKAAIKTLHPHLTQNKQVVARFHREGLIASRLAHPNAVKMYNLGQTESGVLWIAMEFIEGEPLSAKLRRDGPLSVDELVSLFIPVCEVLEEAHKKGVTHRDLKPDNIMLVRGTGDGWSDISEQGTAGEKASALSPKLLDFGIAGLLDDEALTKTGSMSGTPPYMPQEQWKGLKHTDARTDLYALGVILYQCLSNQLPFDADSVPAWMHQHCFVEARNLSEAMHGRPLPPALNTLVMKAIQKEPNDRYQTAHEFAAALRASVTAPLQNSEPSIRPEKLITQPSLVPQSIVPQPVVHTLQPVKQNAWLPFVAVGVVLVVALSILYGNGAGPSQKEGSLLSTPLIGSLETRLVGDWSATVTSVGIISHHNMSIKNSGQYTWHGEVKDSGTMFTRNGVIQQNSKIYGSFPQAYSFPGADQMTLTGPTGSATWARTKPPVGEGRVIDLRVAGTWESTIKDPNGFTWKATLQILSSGGYDFLMTLDESGTLKASDGRFQAIPSMGKDRAGVYLFEGNNKATLRNDGEALSVVWERAQ
jgi:serine/threonine protein kinase